MDASKDLNLQTSEEHHDQIDIKTNSHQSSWLSNVVDVGDMSTGQSRIIIGECRGGNF